MTDDGELLAGRYRLVRRIGSGAMGVVWQGHDERLDRAVAVKKLLLRPGLSQAKAAEALARCLREGRIAARLHHPNAISVFDVVDEDDVPNLVMEYLPSRSLATAIAEDGPLAPADAADIGAQVATALAAAHDADIVHRDITPGNVLLGEDGSVKLTDFGISRAADDVAATKTGSIGGTPAYMAPEVAHGTDPTPASDVFSLGATLYAAVEGAPPFGKATNVFALLHAVAGGEINPPQQAGPLTDVLLALLKPDADARPTAAQAKDLLAAAVAKPDAPADPESTQVAAAPVVAGRSHKALAAAGVVVVALTAAGLWLLGSHQDRTPGHEQAPADGNGHNRTTQTTGPAPVAPVGDPIDLDEKPATEKPTSRQAPAAGNESAAEPPATNQTPTLPPTTTDEPVKEPTVSDPATEPPPSSADASTPAS